MGLGRVKRMKDLCGRYYCEENMPVEPKIRLTQQLVWVAVD